jgi:hypothetical protein
LEHIAVQKVKLNFVSNNRSALVTLTASFLMIPLAGHASPQSVFAQVDHFIEGHSARQPQ